MSPGGDADGQIGRRGFLQSMGRGFVVLSLTPIACSDSGDDDPSPTCTGLNAVSQLSDGHAHTLCVSTQDLTAPPAGGKAYTSSVVEGRGSSGYAGPQHDHSVFLTAAQLTQIAAGQVVTVQSAVSENHLHEFQIRM